MPDKIISASTDSTSKFSLITFLLILLIALQGFNSLLMLPIVGSKLQPFELVSLLVCIIAIFKWIKLSDLLHWTILDIALLFHITSILISLAFNYNRTAMLESLGSAYLFILYFILSRLLMRIKQEKVLYILKNGNFLSIIFCLLSAVAGYFIYKVYDNRDYVLYYPDYPYFGDMVRLSGFASSPNVLLSILFVSFAIYFYLNKKISAPLLTAGLLVSFFTLSKELFIYSIGIVYIYFIIYKNKMPLKGIVFQYAAVLILYVVFFYFIFTPPGQTTTALNPMIVGTESIFENDFVAVYPTTYYYLANAEIDVIKQSFPFGCGKGNFLPLLNEYQTAGNYPSRMWTNEPHDVYLGAVAEMGIPGLIAIILVIYAIIYQFRRLTAEHHKDKNLLYLLFIILILWSIESTGLGTLQLRHYWLVFAIFNYFWLRKKSQTLI